MVTMTEPKPARLDLPEHPTRRADSIQHSATRHRRMDRVAEALGGRRAAFAAFTGTIVTALWITLFTIGLTVPSQPYRDRLLHLADPQAASNAYGPSVIEAFVVIAFAYTPTNLAMLCIVASLTGCLGHLATTNDAAAERARNRELRVTVVTQSQTDSAQSGGAPGNSTSAASAAETSTVQESYTQDSIVSPLAPAITAVTWGFFIYLIIVSGTVVLTGDPFKETSPEQYLRMAGSASLLAFAVGWQPQILAQMVSNVGSTKLLKPS
ncbi:MAG: hypothetical protein IT436_04505 [Phycisphaerales bacterium]|nr:hypothetical protein [Phycisphaerales bacterium]